jgi:hypothetical protein
VAHFVNARPKLFDAAENSPVMLVRSAAKQIAFGAVRGAIDEWRYRPWDMVSRPAATAWLGFYVLFLIHAARNTEGSLLIDNVNLIIHEGGHLLFGWLGASFGLYGGTLLQSIVPGALAASFAYRKHTAGTIFCLFFFFENFLYIATYMADARLQELPLVSIGGGEAVDHDWQRILSGLGLLQHDTQIAAVVRAIGWIGMLATVAWLLWRASQDAKSKRAHAASA